MKLESVTWPVVVLVGILIVSAFAFGHDPKAPRGAQTMVDTARQCWSIFVSKDGVSTSLDATLVIRLPEHDSAGHPYTTEQFQQFASWLNDQYEGWTRWEVQSSSTSAESENKWIYMIGLSNKMVTTDVTNQVKAKTKEVFHDSGGLLVVELSHPPIPG